MISSDMLKAYSLLSVVRIDTGFKFSSRELLGPKNAPISSEFSCLFSSFVLCSLTGLSKMDSLDCVAGAHLVSYLISL